MEMYLDYIIQLNSNTMHVIIFKLISNFNKMSSEKIKLVKF